MPRLNLPFTHPLKTNLALQDQLLGWILIGKKTIPVIRSLVGIDLNFLLVQWWPH